LQIEYSKEVASAAPGVRVFGSFVKCSRV
jgi:hypothetical protein